MDTPAAEAGLTVGQCFVKRSFDVLFSAGGLLLFGWLLVPAFIVSRIDTGQSGIFRQLRVGLHGKRFYMIKIRTMRSLEGESTVNTTVNDPRITRFGGLLRRAKLDELPQLFNILRGDMSFVGPRPDVPEYMDTLSGGDCVILNVRPGITGPATLRYRNEEKLLATKDDPKKFNDEVIFPDKIRINREYVKHYSFLGDLRYIWQTIFPSARV